jgi:hypothetical protein
MGVMNTWLYMLIQVLNILAALSQTNFDLIISKFVSYGALITIP